MKFNDLTQLLEQDESIFIARRLKERVEQQRQEQLRIIYDYINNGSIGDLNLINTVLTTLPKGLHVGDNLFLMDSKIIHLPDDIKIKGGLYLRGSEIMRLPDNLKVDDLNISHTKNITQLPRGLSVNRRILCDFSNITYIPDDIWVKEMLTLTRTPIKKLPDNLHVDELNIRYTDNIESLPNNLTAGTVAATGSKLKHIPQNNKIKKLIIYNTPLIDPVIKATGDGEHNPKYPNIKRIYR